MLKAVYEFGEMVGGGGDDLILLCLATAEVKGYDECIIFYVCWQWKKQVVGGGRREGEGNKELMTTSCFIPAHPTLLFPKLYSTKIY